MKKIKFHIPKKLQRKPSITKMTKTMIEEGKRLLLLRYSQAFVAKQLGISRHTLLMHCEYGYREKYKARYKTYAYQKEHTNLLKRAREKALERYHIISNLYPRKMKKYRKKRKEVIGKEYFKNYMKNYKRPNL